MNRILIIKPSSLGDIIHGLVVAQSIREQLPDCQIAWVAQDRFAPVVKSCPTVDRTIVFHRYGGPATWLRLAQELHDQEYDYALDFQGLARSALMLMQARARHKLGRADAREGAVWTYPAKVEMPPAGAKAHAIEVLLRFLPAMGLEPRLGSPIKLGTAPLPSPFEDLPARRPIVITPNSRDAVKEWPGFVELTRLILTRHPGIPVVWDSHRKWETPPDLADCAHFFNLTTLTTLPQMNNLIQSARMVIANDSGPIHIAAAVGAPVVACFGPTPAERFGPYPLDRPTHRVVCAPDGDLKRLPPEEVLRAVTDLLPASDKAPHAC